jgi:hypothetical protein
LNTHQVDSYLTNTLPAVPFIMSAEWGDRAVRGSAQAGVVIIYGFGQWCQNAAADGAEQA